MSTSYQLVFDKVLKENTRAFTQEKFNAFAIKKTGWLFKTRTIVPVTVSLQKQSCTIYYEWKVDHEGHSELQKDLTYFLKNEGKKPSQFYVALNNDNPDWIRALKRADEIQQFYGNAVC